MSYQFQSGLYDSRHAMLDAIASAWLTADGSNNSQAIAESLTEATDQELAAECVEGWGLATTDTVPEGGLSHMVEHDYTLDDLAAAFTRYRQQQQEGN